MVLVVLTLRGHLVLEYILSVRSYLPTFSPVLLEVSKVFEPISEIQRGIYFNYSGEPEF